MAGSLWNKFLNFIGLEENAPPPYVKNPAYYDRERGAQPNKGAAHKNVNYNQQQNQPRSKRPVPPQGGQANQSQNTPPPPPYQPQQPNMGRVTPLPPQQANYQRPFSEHRTVIWYLRQFEDCREIIYELLDSKSVLLICEDVDERVCQRAVDMLSGAAFALDATIKRASHATYLIAPRSVVISGSDEEETKGFSLGGGLR